MIKILFKKKTFRLLFLSGLCCLVILCAACSAPAPDPGLSPEGTSPVNAIVVDEPPMPSVPEPAENVPEEPEFEEYTISLMALGDNLMHMGIVWTGEQPDGTRNYDFLFRNITPYLEEADIKIINQETILGGNELGFSGFPYFNSPTEVGDAIADAGFNVVLHSSNHSADQQLQGILNCVSFWETHPEVLMVGLHGEPVLTSDKVPSDPVSGGDAALADVSADGGDQAAAENARIPLLTLGDVTFAVLNYAYAPNSEVIPKSIRGYMDILCDWNEETGAIDLTSLSPRVLEDIQAAKELADIVIVCPHWGTEYSTKPSSYQKDWAMQMTEAGADVIIGTHPHVVQPVEWITAENGNRSLCYYSLGNYVSTQQNPLCMLEAMAWVTFRVTEDGVVLEEDSCGALPLVCHYNAGPLRLQDVYLLEDYTEELAAVHGIWSWGNVPLHLSDLQKWTEEILGDFAMASEDILPPKAADPDGNTVSGNEH